MAFILTVDEQGVVQFPDADWCTLAGVQPVSDLKEGMDFRLPEYRREVFLRFYEFHCKYKSHPGAVYYAFPYLFEKYKMTTEEKLWFCFINGLSQNVITTFKLWLVCPDFTVNGALANLFSYFRAHYEKFGWDTDRRYVKNSFEKAVNHYVSFLAGRTQERFFSDICYKHNPYEAETIAKDNFDLLWQYVMTNFYLFGRLSTFSYLEYLKIAGLDIECSNLFMGDIDGSKSHRNGLCKVLGRDDLDWHSSNPNFDGKYTNQQIDWLTKEGETLLQEAKDRGIDASYFTLESTLCCYKSWYRKNRRYPNVYNDMFYERILRDEKMWGVTNHLFRELRQKCLPNHLLIENNQTDPGLKPEKQNHFRTTGEVIMMDVEWPCFKNKFNQKHYGI